MSEPRASSSGGLQLLGAGTAFQEELCSMVGEMPLFADFEWHELREVVKFMQAYRVPSGTVLFKEGDQGSFMCLLIEGRVDILKEDGQQTRRVVASVGPGKTLGEMAIVDGERRSATGMVAQPSVLALLTKENFLRINREQPAVGVKILMKIARLLSQRLRYTSGLLVDYLDQ